jgi:hypothetical protein
MFGPKRKLREAGEDCILSFIACVLHKSVYGDHVKDNEMSEAFGTISGDEKCIQNFGRNT